MHGSIRTQIWGYRQKKKMTLTEQGNEYGDFDTIWNFFCYSRIIPNILYVDSIFITY